MLITGQGRDDYTLVMFWVSVLEEMYVTERQAADVGIYNSHINK